MRSAEFLIVGGGLAGVAAAYHLTRLGVESVAVLEQEPELGVHSSGRNAAMIRQVVPEPAIGDLARDGAAFLRSRPGDWDEGIGYRPCGSLLLGRGATAESLRRDMAQGTQGGIGLEWLEREECLSRIPALEGGPFDGGVFCPADGVVDLKLLVGGYAREAAKRGARFARAERAIRARTVAGRVQSVESSGETYRVKWLIDAAGAWAAEVGEMAGALKAPLVPNRRHLFQTQPVAWADADWPFVWNTEHEVYFRPEAGGFLTSPCDESVSEPGIPPEDPAAAVLLQTKLKEAFPRIAGLPMARAWAGLRILTPDRRFLIGFDPRLQGFFWLAGLGGHGVTCSSAVGSLTARLLTDISMEPPAAFAPERFV